MKLFDLFGRKDDKDTDERNKGGHDIRELEIYSGMRVIVENLEGKMLFIAKLQDPQKNMAQLYQYSKSELLLDEAGQGETASVSVKIRGYNDVERKAIFMEGTITPGQEHVWKVKDLAVLKVENERSFPRMSTNIDAVITVPGEASGAEESCKLLNISVGGASIGTEQRYYKGDTFLLKAKLVEESPAAVLYCEVLRITERNESWFEYGCRFLELTEAGQEQITQDIAHMHFRRYQTI